MPETWIGCLVGRMFENGIKGKELAKAAELNEKYLSSILNGHESPKNAEEKLTAALNKIILEKAKK